MSDTLTVSEVILQQLGGKKFLLMTGSKNLMTSNTDNWLRMDLVRNESGTNRLKITLKGDDTYEMYFYKQVISKNLDVSISKEQTFSGLHFDQLQDIFTEVTGMYTKL